MTRRPSRPLRAGVIGLALLAALIYAAFNADRLPLIGGGTEYSAMFSEAGGLREGDEVRVAGVKVGRVEGLDLDGAAVRVRFRVTDDDLALGTRTGAEIQIRTVLGRKYLALRPAGPERLDPDDAIPLARTVAPYDVVEAFSDLTVTTEEIDTAQLAEALDAVSAAFENTPDDVAASLTGLSRLAETISSRDAELRTLLQRSNQVTEVLAERDEELVTLIQDGAALLQELRRRREEIHRLLVTSTELSEQLRGLVDDNARDLRPALRRLGAVIDLLESNAEQLDQSIERLAPFTRVFANTLGTGPWFDTYIPNLLPLPATPRLPLDAEEGGG